MANTTHKRIPAEILLADREVLLTLQSLPDYAPTDERYSVASLQKLAEALDRAEEAEVIARRAYEQARERLIAARAAYHEAILATKLQVVAQYGTDSPAVHAVGLKQKSEYRRNARRKPPMA